MLKNLFQNIKDSIYNPAFYQRLGTEISFRASINYFFRLVGVLAFVGAVIMAMGVALFYQKDITSTVDSVFASYPADLIVTVEDGQVRINQASPYFFPIDTVGLPDTVSIDLAEESIENLIVIDTEHPFSTDLFQNYKTAILVTADSVVVQNKKEIRIMEIGDSISQVIDQASVKSFAKTVNVFIMLLPIFLLIALFIGFVFVSIFYLFYLLIPAFIIFIAAMVTKAKWHFSKAYQIALHAMTVPLILWFLTMVFGVNIKVKFLFTAILLLVVVVNLYYVKPASDASPLPPAA